MLLPGGGWESDAYDTDPVKTANLRVQPKNVPAKGCSEDCGPQLTASWVAGPVFGGQNGRLSGEIVGADRLE